MRIHPSPELLALYATSDTSWRERWKLRRHIARCEGCERQITLFHATIAELKQQAGRETLSGFEAITDWTRLEREMEGNIIVGVAAARCVDKVRHARGWMMKAAVGAGIVGLSFVGWVTRVPPEQTAKLLAVLRDGFSFSHRNESTLPVLKTQPDGIVTGSQFGSLTILHPVTAVVSVSGTSSMEARYIDEETGQITINNVYGQ